MKTFRQFMVEMHDTLYDYSSTQINLPPTLSNSIIEWGEDNIKDKYIFKDPDDLSMGREDEIHVTLLYGLHANNHERVKKVLKSEKTFKIHLGEVSMFKNNSKFDVVQIEAISPQLHKLHETLSQKLACTEKYPKYIPHVTIAYVKKDSCENLLGNKNFQDKSWTATAVIFSSKSGVKTPIQLKAS